jgi:small neutral amino acid transporter SnatA (MarC family)
VAAASHDIESPAHHEDTQQDQQQQQQLAVQPVAKRSAGWKLLNYCVIPLAMPLLAAWWLLALLLAAAATFSIWPSLLLARRLYWACPFILCIWAKLGREQGWVASWLLRLQFEGAHCMTLLGRLLSLPLRPHLPHFYILGFPVSG